MNILFLHVLANNVRYKPSHN